MVHSSIVELERSLAGGVLLDLPFDPEFGATPFSDEDDFEWLTNPSSPVDPSTDLFKDLSSDHIVLSRMENKSDALSWDSILHGVHDAVKTDKDMGSVMWDGSDSVLEDDEFGPPPALRSIFGHMPTPEELQFQAFVNENESSSSEDDVLIADGDIFGQRRPKKAKHSNNKRFPRTKSVKATTVTKAKKAALATMQRKSATRPGFADTPEGRRHTHNILERKRREDLKSSYRALRAQVPELADSERAPTGQILIKAAEFIAQLQAEEQRMLQQLETLRAQNVNLVRMQAGVCS